MISIIIPTFNRDALLGATLDSIRAQDFHEWECIVVDDGSEDYTKEIMQFYCELDHRILFVSRPKEKNKGANSCRNYGFELCKGEKILWFDSDDLMEPDYLATASEIFRSKMDHLDVIICNYKIFMEKPCNTVHIQHNKIHNLALDYYCGRINFGLPHLIWNRNIVEAIKFDEKLKRAQELDFNFKIFSSKNINWQQIQRPMVLVRRHKSSLTGNYNDGGLESIKSELKVRKTIIDFLNTSNVDRQKLLKALDIYLCGLKKLIEHGNIFLISRELHRLRLILEFNNRFSSWKNKLYLYTFLMQAGLAKYRLKKHLFDLKKCLR